MENILTDGHCLSPYTCKCCIVFKQFDGLNIDSLAGKRQKRQNFPHQSFPLYGIGIVLSLEFTYNGARDLYASMEL